MTLEKFDDKYDTYVTLAPNTEPCYNKYHGELCKNNDNVLGRCHDDKKCTSESDFSSDEQELLNDICSDEHEENKLKNKYCVFHDISYVIDARVELTNTFNLGAIDTDDISHCSGENNLCNSKNARGSLCSNSNNNRCFGIPYEKICECKNDDLINNYFNYICSIFSDDLEQNYYKIRHIINENELLYLRNNLDDFCEIVNIEEPFLDDTTHETLPNAASVIQLTSVPEQKEVEGEKALKGKISDKSKSNDVNSKEIIELSKYIENKNINFVETSKNSDDTISFGYDIDNNEQSDLFIITDLLGYVTKVNFNEINHLSHNYGFHFNDPASSGYDVLFYELKSGSNQNLKYISHILYDEEWTYNPNDKTILLEKINFENDFSLSEEEKNAIIQIYSTINLWFENIISNDISMEINNFGGLLNTLEGSTLTISIFNTDYITQIDETKWSGNIDIKFNPEINFYIQYSELKDIPEYNYISEYNLISEKIYPLDTYNALKTSDWFFVLLINGLDYNDIEKINYNYLGSKNLDKLTNKNKAFDVTNKNLLKKEIRSIKRTKKIISELNEIYLGYYIYNHIERIYSKYSDKTQNNKVLNSLQIFRYSKK